MNRKDQNVYVFAARYAHHRGTGASLQVTVALKEVWDKLDQDTREQIVRESYEAGYNLDDWEEFRKWAKQNPQ